MSYPMIGLIFPIGYPLLHKESQTSNRSKIAAKYHSKTIAYRLLQYLFNLSAYLRWSGWKRARYVKILFHVVI